MEADSDSWKEEVGEPCYQNYHIGMFAAGWKGHSAEIERSSLAAVLLVVFHMSTEEEESPEEMVETILEDQGDERWTLVVSAEVLHRQRKSF
jgi:hypothetical protein